MFRFLMIGIVLLALSACSPLTSASGAANPTQPTPLTSATSLSAVTETPITGAGITAPAVILPSNPTYPSQVSSTPTPTMEVPSSSIKWQVYTNPDWHLTLNYPIGWTVNSSASQVDFTPPRDGIPVQLTLLNNQGASLAEPLPNTRCAELVNNHGVSIKRCYDLVSFAYESQFTINTNLISISTTRHADLTVYDAMLDSIQPLN